MLVTKMNFLEHLKVSQFFLRIKDEFLFPFMDLRLTLNYLIQYNHLPYKFYCLYQRVDMDYLDYIYG